MILLKLLALLILAIMLFIIFLLFVLMASPIKGEVWVHDNALILRGKYLFGLLKILYEPGHIKVYFAGFHLNKKNSSDAYKSAKENKSRLKREKKNKNKNEKKKKGIPSKEVIVLSIRPIKKIIRKVLPDKVILSIKLGLDDPYDTGMACLINQTLCYPLNKLEGYDLSFQPLYDTLDMKIEAYGKINFTLLSLLTPIFFWAIKKPIRNYMGWTFKK